MKPHAQATFPAPVPAGRRRRTRQAGRPALFRRPAVRTLLSRPRLLLGAAAAVVGMILFSAGAAFAYFLLTDSSANAQAMADTLPAPTGATQDSNGRVTSASIPLTWAAPAGSPSYTPTGYQVLRCAGDGCTNFAPVTSGGCAKVTTTSCTDTDSALSPSTKYSYEVGAELDSWVSGPSTGFTASTAGPAQLAFTTQPSQGQSIQAKGTGTFSVTVAVQDSNGTTVTNDTSDQVTLGLTGGTSGATLSCSGSVSHVQASSGVVTFTSCAVDKAGTGYQLTATSGTLTQATSNTFNLTAGNAAHFSFTTQPPGSSRSGAAFPVAVAVQDGNGNPLTGDNSDQVTLGLTGGTSGAQLTCGGPGRSTQASSGVATFTGCAVDRGGSGYKLTATSGSLTSATSNTFSITGSQLAFTAQPSSSIQAKGTGKFSVTVAVQDSTGATDTSDNSDQVTLGLTGGISGATMSCDNSSAQVSSGQATFSNCAVDEAGTGYQLTATSGSLKSATSNSFNITAGNAAQVLATSGGSQSAQMSTDFANPLVVTVEDVNGNPLSTAGTSVKFQAPPSSGPSATFPGCSNPCTVTTDANGQATVTIHANNKAGQYAIAVGAAGPSSASFSETNIAKPSVTASLATADGTGGTPGKLDAGDSVSVVFSGDIDPSTVCSGWSAGNTPVIAGTVSIGGGGTGNPNTLTFTPASACSTFNLGTIGLGSAKYYTPGSSGGLSFTNSTIAYDASSDTLTITLGGLSIPSGSEGTVPSSALKLPLSSSILDANDIALKNSNANATNGPQF